MNVTNHVQRGAPTFRLAAEPLPLLGLTAVWIALALAVDPSGDFPLLDDWSYGRAVKTLVEEGRLFYDGWNTPTLTMQVLYGALFCLPFGFSFESLRLATLMAGLAGGLAVYALLREASASRLLAMCGSLSLMLNPGYFQHSFTFMTDVPFAALSVLSAFFYARSLKTGSARDAAYGTILAACAALVRQLGIAIPLGYGLALFTTGALDRRTLLRACLPFAAVVCVVVLHGRFLDYLQMTPALADAFQKSIALQLQSKGVIGLLRDAFKLGEASFSHVSLFLLPCTLVLFGRGVAAWRVQSRVRVLLYVGIPFLVLLLYWRFWPPALPIRVFGVAHSVMYGPHPWSPANEPLVFRQAVWTAEIVATLLMLSLLGGIAASGRKRSSAPDRADIALALFGSSVAVTLLLPFALAGDFNERYLIPAIPFAVLALVALCKHALATHRDSLAVHAASGGIVILIVYGLLSVFFAHDYLALNRARWVAVNYLVRDKDVAPRLIDGGLTVNGWHLFPVEGPLREKYINWKFMGGAWWRNNAAEYIVGIDKHRAPAPDLMEAVKALNTNVEIVFATSYKAWLPGTSGRIVVCRGAGCGEYFHHGVPSSGN